MRAGKQTRPRGGAHGVFIPWGRVYSLFGSVTRISVKQGARSGAGREKGRGDGRRAVRIRRERGRQGGAGKRM
ncbi:hypothetical protein ROR02_19710 [Pararhodospirillum oryzae]|uniref:Uncharacterized protein n=1 Tax=Pararhodospirillum oryzae TaxID=478448 RepID=A0A512H8V5_9PROT|nr:hypothetical protein ROR02_19710 [Pararhodospirillum oryzae]